MPNQARRICLGLFIVTLLLGLWALESTWGDDSDQAPSYRIAAAAVARTLAVKARCGAGVTVEKYSSHRVYLDSAVYLMKAVGPQGACSVECKVVKDRRDEWRVAFVRLYRTNLEQLQDWAWPTATPNK
ncbi:hypothetical protein GCM10027048_16150 [Hymenobacter coalescens]